MASSPECHFGVRGKLRSRALHRKNVQKLHGDLEQGITLRTGQGRTNGIRVLSEVVKTSVASALRPSGADLKWVADSE
eukprot:CAMPEP_0198734480 /NCGR_PEP_ID=MMETSP1475-20131203/52866_1 /TAXON_ID= ORGANISM="Unidentified sp., Strain CCMP1999" /NCGR_SAMPLE_ID=MMETSP1475 /ASSEMBLY_ACC=CAM_ASM_001111 /LENGTH=77 /DNA_ID=CAMNT_0044497959 /DNA_START=439 /DNA_END=672 /DNA_ORIENTATION=-